MTFLLSWRANCVISRSKRQYLWLSCSCVVGFLLKVSTVWFAFFVGSCFRWRLSIISFSPKRGNLQLLSFFKFKIFQLNSERKAIRLFAQHILEWRKLILHFYVVNFLEWQRAVIMCIIVSPFLLGVTVSWVRFLNSKYKVHDHFLDQSLCTLRQLGRLSEICCWFTGDRSCFLCVCLEISRCIFMWGKMYSLWQGWTVRIAQLICPILIGNSETVFAHIPVCI